ncbi:MAG: eL32 family ribosomal protein [Candidatus Anstonellales archaeon]
MKKKKIPYFHVPNAGGKRGKVRVKSRWRKPRGAGNKKRMRWKSCGPSPRVGYKNPAVLRGRHPSGMREFLVRNEKELGGIDKKTTAIRIASGVGKKKRSMIEAMAKELDLKVLNPSKAEGVKK